MGFNIILFGDCILNHKRADDQKLIDICNKADLCIGNFESVIHNFEYPPEKYNGQGIPMQSPPSITEVLLKYNIRMVAHANNHSNDYGIGGLISSINFLSKSNIKVAGIGMNREEASKAALTTINETRIGLISSTTSYTQWAIATPHNNYIKGRPGVNYVELNPNLFFYLSKGLRVILNKTQNNRLIRFFYFGDYNIPGIEYKKIREQISESRQSSDILFYSMHSHQGLPGKPSKALKRLARFCIDNGVDVFFSHGSHELRGIEIYKGKPIFYGLGNFFAQSQNVQAYPADYLISKGIDPNSAPDRIRDELSKVIIKKPQWWYSIAVKLLFIEDNQLSKIEIIPIDLSMFESLGWPHLAVQDKRDLILSTIRRLSQKFGTIIRFDTDHAEIVLKQ